MGRNTENILKRGEANLEKNKDKKALRLFNEVLNREPSHLQALRSKAVIKINLETWDEAELFLLFAIKLQPKDDQLRQLLGSLYQKADKPEKAIMAFQKALEFNKSNNLAHYGLGILYAKAKNNHTKAVTHFSNVIDTQNKTVSADIFFNRGCSYMILKQLEKAEKDLQKARELGHQKAEEMIDAYFN